MPRQRLPVLLRQIPAPLKLRLLLLLVAGGLLGFAAGVTSSHALQYCLVLFAIAVGIYAGIVVRRARRAR